jgi:hypothetical protein
MDTDEANFPLPLGWQRITMPYSEAMLNPILGKELLAKYHNKDVPQHVWVYKQYKQQHAVTYCRDWRKVPFEQQFLDERSVTTVFPKKHIKPIFHVPKHVVVAPPHTTLEDALKMPVDKALVRINTIKRMLYIMAFGYYIQVPEVTLASMNASIYERATAICTDLCGSGLTKQQVMHTVWLSAVAVCFIDFA